jgi:glutamine cyclotransferase
MGRSFFPLLLVCSIFITAFSCSNKASRSRKPVSSITVTPNKNNYVFGEKVSVNVKTRVKNGEIETVKVYFNNQLIDESDKPDFNVDGIEISKTGTNNITVEPIKKDGVKNYRTKTLNAFSNLNPKKYDYKIVNIYPHSTEYYTQGLEYHNDFIYEGTGENGTSGLFKVNLKTGKEVLAHRLADKYFGEGITKLNDKIYQLTYRAQKGYVYNFSDFAVVDSFQYKGEGWGLTNDGKHLIMSNGTNVITWLNPDDFSVVKTVEVADNQGLIFQINELEMIEGSIFANLYTTEKIIEIDPETGRVLSEASFPGIINMYHKPGDRIDYMNGIAYNKQTKRLFITGKLWPKLFEVELIPQAD